MHKNIHILKQLPRQGQPIKPSAGQVTDGSITDLGSGITRPSKPLTSDVTDDEILNLGAGAQTSTNADERRLKILSGNSNTLNPKKDLIAKAGQQAIKGAIGLVGNPIADSITAGAINSTAGVKPSRIYTLSSYEDIKDYGNTLARFAKYRDFRWLSGFKNNNPRLDGTSALVNLAAGFPFSPRTAAYAAANFVPGGVYTLFNRETLYGWGDHGSPTALRNDFTARTQVSTRWQKGAGETKGKWVQDPAGIATPFRGDKINVVDYSKRTLKNVYKWKPDQLINLELPEFLNEFDQTQDFIKFYFTGPTLHAANESDTDDIIVFRATLSSLTDSYNANWNSKAMIGRADPNWTYSGFSRGIQFSFDVHATSRDEMKPIWRKLNALASYTTPEYVDNIALKGPWMRFTLGDLFVQQPILLTSVQYTLQDSNTSWEINVEDDKSMMQVPKYIGVTIQAEIIPDELPRKNGRMYSLAKRFSDEGNLGILSQEGSDNWLSGFETEKTAQQNRVVENRAIEQVRATINTLTELRDKAI
jgi:hypothetical protein